MITPLPFAIKCLPRTWLKHILMCVFFSMPVLRHFLSSAKKANPTSLIAGAAHTRYGASGGPQLPFVT